MCVIRGCSNLGRSRGNGGRGKLCETHHRKKYPRKAGIIKRRSRNWRLGLYGLTTEKYNKMVASQNGCCAICGLKLNKPYIDHCHQTGLVRGVLCNKCNWGLGMFDDDIDLLASATSYLLNNASKKEIA